MNNCFDIIIVGAGILGLSSAYYASRKGKKRILVLDRNQPISATTSQAAGLLGLARSDSVVTGMVRETYRVMTELEKNLGEKIEARFPGSLHIAHSTKAVYALSSMVETLGNHHIETQWLEPQHCLSKVGFLQLPPSSTTVYVPDDGYVDPYSLASAYLKMALRQGVKLELGNGVSQLLVEQGRICGVKLANGEDYYGEKVVLACGPWSSILAAKAGIALPMAPVRSQYWITEKLNVSNEKTPVLVLPEANAYVRNEIGAILFGLRDQLEVSAHPNQLREDIQGFCFERDPQGWESLEQGYPSVLQYLPLLENTSIENYVAGVSSYTPDGKFVLGRHSNVQGLIIAGGCCGAGVGTSGGFGRIVAQLIDEQPGYSDIQAFAPDRFNDADPFCAEFRSRCCRARSAKVSG